ncbi:hypothetical protein J6590_015490 [Homalodisca vitripennis]|nr:hypothetical protein J6590_015490 [Homalodisca vitripennis]
MAVHGMTVVGIKDYIDLALCYRCQRFILNKDRLVSQYRDFNGCMNKGLPSQCWMEEMPSLRKTCKEIQWNYRLRKQAKVMK